VPGVDSISPCGEDGREQGCVVERHFVGNQLGRDDDVDCGGRGILGGCKDGRTVGWWTSGLDYGRVFDGVVWRMLGAESGADVIGRVKGQSLEVGARVWRSVVVYWSWNRH
jgi:hypothetical protein